MSVLITGTSYGVGRATALKFMEEGYSVIGLDWKPATIPLSNSYIHHQCDVSDFNSLPDLINIEYIVNNLVNRGNYNYTEYIKYLFEKDDWKEDDPRHQLFHYDAPYTLPNSTCNNTELLELIDNLNEDDIENMDSIVNSANKILYLAALRIWIEKQFYDNTNDAVGLRGQKCLGNKIRFMIDENHWNGQAQIKKDFLMSKKVMLNQNDHAKGQKEPFYYALSISTDDIIKEIIQIKNHFQH